MSEVSVSDPNLLEKEKKFEVSSMVSNMLKTAYPDYLNTQENQLPFFLRRKTYYDKRYKDYVYLTEEIMKFSNKGYKGFIQAVKYLIDNAWGFDAFIVGPRGSGKSNVLYKVSTDGSKAINKPFTFKKNLFVGNSIIFDVFWLVERGFGNNEWVVLDEGGASEAIEKSSGISSLKKASRKFFMIKRDFDMPFLVNLPDETDMDQSIIDKDMMFRIVCYKRNHQKGYVEFDIEWNAMKRDLRGITWIDFAKNVRLPYVAKELYDEYLAEKKRKFATEESYESMKEKYELNKKVANERRVRKIKNQTLIKIREIRNTTKIEEIEIGIFRCLDLMEAYNSEYALKKDHEISKQDIYNYFRNIDTQEKKKIGNRKFNEIFAEWELQNVSV